MEIKMIEQLMSGMAAHGVTSLEWEEGETRLCLKRDTPQVVYTKSEEVVLPAPAASAAPAQEAKAVTEGLKDVLSPMVGTYHQPASGAVKVGTTLKKGEVLCVIEAMKLMNDITMEEDGEIVFLAIKDGDMVEYGQVIAQYR